MEDTQTPSRTVIMFLAKYDADGEYIMHKEFNLLAGKHEFEEGPFVTTFGSGYGDPYVTSKQCFGMLKDGRCVWSEFQLG